VPNLFIRIDESFILSRQGGTPKHFNLRPAGFGLRIVYAYPSKRHWHEGGNRCRYSRATAAICRRLRRSTAASPGFRSRVVRVLTAPKHRTSSSRPIRSISPRQRGDRKFRDHRIAQLLEMELSRLFAPPPGCDMHSHLRRQSIPRQPVQETKHRTRSLPECDPSNNYQAETTAPPKAGNH